MGACNTIAVLKTRVDALDYGEAASRIIRAAKNREHGYVCAANVHMVMEGWDDASFRNIVNGARLVVPDGMPLVWAMRMLGCPGQTRVYGPTLMRHCLDLASRDSVRIGLLGGTEASLLGLIHNINQWYPTVEISYSFSYPFDKVSSDELNRITARIRASETQLLFVGLGCPKQERWMARVTDVLPMILFGVGAAFDFFSGSQPMAPAFLQQVGLEWAYRLVVEPRRLFKRYAKHNPRFVALLFKQLLRSRLRK